MTSSILYVEGGRKYILRTDSNEEIKKSEDIDKNNRLLRKSFQALIPNKNISLGFSNAETFNFAKKKKHQVPML
jgi:hypothetical protein